MPDQAGTMSSDHSKERTTDSLKPSEGSRQASDVKPATPREQRPLKPIKKFISRPPPTPPQPKQRSPPPPKVEHLPTPDRKPSRQRTPSPMPQPVVTKRPPTPLPGFITQFKGQEWFEKFFPNCNEQVSKFTILA